MFAAGQPYESVVIRSLVLFVTPSLPLLNETNQITALEALNFKSLVITNLHLTYPSCRYTLHLSELVHRLRVMIVAYFHNFQVLAELLHFIVEYEEKQKALTLHSSLHHDKRGSDSRRKQKETLKIQ